MSTPRACKITPPRTRKRREEQPRLRWSHELANQRVRDPRAGHLSCQIPADYAKNWSLLEIKSGSKPNLQIDLRGTRGMYWALSNYLEKSKHSAVCKRNVWLYVYRVPTWRAEFSRDMKEGRAEKVRSQCMHQQGTYPVPLGLVILLKLDADSWHLHSAGQCHLYHDGCRGRVSSLSTTHIERERERERERWLWVL